MAVAKERLVRILIPRGTQTPGITRGRGIRAGEGLETIGGTIGVGIEAAIRVRRRLRAEPGLPPFGVGEARGQGADPTIEKVGAVAVDTTPDEMGGMRSGPAVWIRRRSSEFPGWPGTRTRCWGFSPVSLSGPRMRLARSVGVSSRVSKNPPPSVPPGR